MTGKFQLFGKNGKYRFNLKAGNGQVILTSESYGSKTSAKQGIASVKKNAGSKARFDRRKSKNGKAYFVLIASNKEIVGTSQMYASKANMEIGIRSVTKNAPRAAVQEMED